MRQTTFTVFAAIVVMTTFVSAQTGAPAAPSQTARSVPTASHDQDAIDALNKMGAYLRTLKAFQIRATTTKEDVLEDGQKIDFETAVDLLARPPDRLRLEVNSDRQQRLFLYDGKNFTLWAERVNYYATVPAPPTIIQLADRLEDKFGIEMPLEDLFLWGTPRSNVSQIKAAMDVGPSQVEGTTCEQYAFRQEGLDWQIWIQDGNYPLPRKLVITTLTDEARPQYSSVLTWNLAPSFNDPTFTFDPPKDAQKIAFAEDNSPAPAGKP